MQTLNTTVAGKNPHKKTNHKLGLMVFFFALVSTQTCVYAQGMTAPPTNKRERHEQINSHLNKRDVMQNTDAAAPIKKENLDKSKKILQQQNELHKDLLISGFITP